MPAKDLGKGLPSFLQDGQTFVSFAKKPAPHSPKVIDPNDPLHASIENLTAGMTPEERAQYLIDLVKAIDQQPPQQAKK